MKQLSRLGIQRMIDGVGSAGNGGGSVEFGAGLASMAWVEEKYLSKDFFLRLFGIHGTDDNDDPVDVTPNDMDTTVTDIEAKLGFWSDSFVSAFGRSTGGGGGGGVTLYEPLNSINSINANPTSANRTLIWTGTQWTYSSIVTSVSMAVPTGFEVTGSPVSSTGTLALTFASGYSLPLTADVTKGVTAYGWGDHAQAGYALASNVYSKTEADNKFLPLSAGSGKPLTGTLYSQSIYPKNNAQYDLGGSTNYWRYLYVNRIYLASGVYLEYDSTNLGVHLVGAGFYSDSFVSAFGASTGGGGGITLNEPLNSINAINANPTSANKTLVWTGSAWTYGSVGSGAVSSITVGSTNYSPVGGVVTLPEYVTLSTAQTISGLKTMTHGLIVSGRAYNSGDDEGIVITGASNSFCGVTLGSTNTDRIVFYYDKSTKEAYFKYAKTVNDTLTVYKVLIPHKSGTIALISDVPTNVSQFTNDASYATTSSLENYLPLTGGTMTGASPIAFTRNKIALDFRPSSTEITWGSKVELMSSGYEALVFSNKSSSSSYIFRNGYDLINSNDWSEAAIGKPAVHITGQSLYVNTHLGTSPSPSYNFYVTGSSYFNGNIAMTSGSRITKNGGYLYIGDSNNAGYVYLQDIASQDGSEYWRINANGNAFFRNVASEATGTYDLGSSSNYWRYLYVNRIYLASDVYFEKDSTGVHLHGAGFYSDSFVSAFGASSGGGTITLNQPLSSINSLNANPSASGQTLVWNGSAWTYGSVGSGSVSSITVGTTNYSPVVGVVTLPEYVTLATEQTISGLKTMTHGLVVSGRVAGGGDDEGIIVAGATNNLCAVTLGSRNSDRVVFYFNKSTSSAYFNYAKTVDDTLTSRKIELPHKAGTIALISDVPTNNNQLTNGAGYITSSGSCASATKLATPRSIWGQSFDGSDNITGTIYLTQNTPHYFRDPNTAAWRGGIYWGTGGRESMSFVAVDSNTKFQFVHGSDISTWTNDTHATATSSMTILSSGVGIGTNSPSYKLDVNGTFYASGNSSIGGTLGVIGATTLSSTLSVSSNTTIGGTLSVTGAATLGGNLSMPSNGRITQGTGALYLGTSNNAGWVYTQDIASQSGSTIWNIKQTGSATFQSVTIGSAVLSWDSTNSCLKISTGMYSDSFISAFGASSGGSSLSLNGVLSSINSSSLAAPSATGQTVVWDGSAWQYSTTSNVTLKADKIYAANGITISSGSLSLSNGSISLPGYINAYGNIITNSKIAIGYSSVSSSYQFYCKNNGYISGTLTQGSDIRRKNIVGDVDMLDINNVASAPIFRFTWKDRDDSHIYAGTSAQYWQDKLPETILSTDEGYLSMDYGATALIATILTARKVVEHERRIRDLETENERLRKEINELKAA